jgi:uncharacterized FlaG/YvyC family protein
MNISTINSLGLPITSYGENQAIVANASPTAELSSTSSKATSFTNADIKGAVETLNNHAKSTGSSVSFHFHVDDTSGKVVIRVMDTNNLMLISQMPSEQALILAQTIGNNEPNFKTGSILKAQA